MLNLTTYFVTTLLMITPCIDALTNDLLFDFTPYLYEEVAKKEELERTPFNKIVSVQRKTFHICTGVVITKRYILTTAANFFFTRESMRIYRVMLGTAGIKRGLVAPIRSVLVNPDYEFGKPQNDVAVLMLAQELPFQSFFRRFRFMTFGLEYAKYGPSGHEATLDVESKAAAYEVSGWPSEINPLKNETAYFDTYNKETFYSTHQCYASPHLECLNALPADSASEYLSRELFCLRVENSSVNLPGAAVYRDDYLFGVVSAYRPDRSNGQRHLYVTRINSPNLFLWLQSI